MHIPALTPVAAATPAERQYPCEFPGCVNRTPASQTYSYLGGVAMPGPGLAAFQCGQEQHFGCCPQHALEVFLACLKYHQAPAHNARLQAAGVTLDPTVLANAEAASAKAGTSVVSGASVSLE